MSTARQRFHLLVIVVLLIAGLLAATAARAQEGPDAESLREAELARQAELAPPSASPSGSVGPLGVVGPLFAGVDDVAIGGYTTTPPSSSWTQLFSGIQVWGSAYNYDNGLLYIVTGSQLYSIDPAVGGAPVLVAPITDPAGTSLSMVSLAYYNGILYSNRNISSTANPEGLYTINATTGVATLVAAFATPASVDIGGLAVDPATGIMYGTDDGTVDRLVTIDKTTAAMVQVAPYPAGETDLDGLAVGGGKAYLIEDDSIAAGGLAHVYNLTTNVYETGIPTPWATSETFSGGAWIEAVGGEGIALDKTVGTDDSVCATTDSIVVPAGTEVTYCYEVTNNSGVTLNRHNLVDSELGTILNNFPFALAPGASAFLTQSAVINVTTVNTGTWTAYNPVTEYTTTAGSCTLPDISTTGTALNLTDDGEANVTLPQPFPFYDLSSAQLRVGNNGGVRFGTTTGDISAGNAALPSASLGPAILPYWDDLDDELGNVYFGSYTYAVAPDAAPSIVAPAGANLASGALTYDVVLWHQRPHFPGSAGANTGTLALAMIQPGQGLDGYLFFCYNDTDFGDPAVNQGASATVGLNRDGTTAEQFSFNTTNPVFAGPNTGIGFTPEGGESYSASDTAEVIVEGATPTPTATTAPPTATATTVPPTATATTVPPTATTVPPTPTSPPTSVELGSVGAQRGSGAGWLFSLAGLALVAAGLVARRRR